MTIKEFLSTKTQEIFKEAAKSRTLKEFSKYLSKNDIILNEHELKEFYDLMKQKGKVQLSNQDYTEVSGGKSQRYENVFCTGNYTCPDYSCERFKKSNSATTQERVCANCENCYITLENNSKLEAFCLCKQEKGSNQKLNILS